RRPLPEPAARWLARRRCWYSSASLALRSSALRSSWRNGLSTQGADSRAELCPPIFVRRSLSAIVAITTFYFDLLPVKEDSLFPAELTCRQAGGMRRGRGSGV